MPPESILSEASRVVSDRENKYSPPLDNFTRIAKMWSAILDIDVSPEKASLCMAALKIARECHESSRDNLVDLAGYAECIHQIKTERDRRASPLVEAIGAITAEKLNAARDKWINGDDDDAPPKLNDLSHTGYATVAKDEPWGLWDRQNSCFVANIIDGYSLVLTRAEAVARASDSPDYYEARPLP